MIESNHKIWELQNNVKNCDLDKILHTTRLETSISADIDENVYSLR